MKLTYEIVLKKTRRQAVNLLEGRFTDNDGVDPRVKFIYTACYGCEYIVHEYNRYACEECPLYILAHRVREILSVKYLSGGFEDCDIDERHPDSLFLVINEIDEMLEGR